MFFLLLVFLSILNHLDSPQDNKEVSQLSSTIQQELMLMSMAMDCRIGPANWGIALTKTLEEKMDDATRSHGRQQKAVKQMDWESSNSGDIGMSQG